MNIKNYLFFLLLPMFMLGQNENSNTLNAINPVKRYNYNDGVTAMEYWYGIDKILDSVKTFHKDGSKNEIFYYNSKNQKHGNAYQYNKQGELLVTWTFENGKLLSRTDHKLPFNKDSEEVIKKAISSLAELNTRTNFNPTKINDIYRRASLRHKLGNNFLSLQDYKIIEAYTDKFYSDPKKIISDSIKIKMDGNSSRLYDAIANIYGTLEMENSAMHYFCKALKLAPKDNRILYNFANFLQHTKSNDLALVYLNKVLEIMPNHAFAQWALAKLYSDRGEYEKAMPHIIIAAEREKNIIERSSGYGGRNIKTTRGLIYHKTGETEKGISDLKAELAIDKNNSYAMKNLGIIYLDQKKYTEACELFQKAKKLEYTKIYDENDLEGLLELACNNPEAIVESEVKSVSATVSSTDSATAANRLPAVIPYIYPNPVQDIIHIIDLDPTATRYELFDYQSKLIQKGECKGSTIEATKLISGFYILKIYKDQITYSFKIIKE
ncbi:T9SS type A sorting domain-containing protein [Flavobacterium sp. NG2]|uniref:T9SS type A sorting domain-containing protein n=1 Tax=Flavobacterium sp. NG2 TaxID=3097547 RepID=UPI002A81ECB0|nr:T9SS type A sorting domain-containing protein [Flavobacterium sp. NG2]WPR71342.1 T9SS type A sorting domain-containing protein [Flavobacterium sp. NG2]